MKLQSEREQQIKAVQAKAAVEREERKKKLSESKKMIYDSRKAIADRRKEESKQINELAGSGRFLTEHDKRLKAEEERKRSA